MAGSSTLRTIVASRRTATASPKPSCLMITSSRVTKTLKTTTMIAAALVIVPDVIEMPRATASFEREPVVAGLLDPGEDEDVVVHREPEQDREDEDGHERLDRARLEAEQLRAVAVLEDERPAARRPRRSRAG